MTDYYDKDDSYVPSICKTPLPAKVNVGTPGHIDHGKPDVMGLAEEILSENELINPLLPGDAIIKMMHSMANNGVNLAQAVKDSPVCIGGIDWGKDYLEEVREKAKQEQKESDINKCEELGCKIDMGEIFLEERKEVAVSTIRFAIEAIREG